MSSHSVRFDITCEREDLYLSMALAMQQGFTPNKVLGWSTDNNDTTLVLHKYIPHPVREEVNKLPAPLSGDTILKFVEAWLDVVDYGPEPRTDGSVEKGVRVFTNSWGNYGEHYNYPSAFVAIEPEWLVYGK